MDAGLRRGSLSRSCRKAIRVLANWSFAVLAVNGPDRVVGDEVFETAYQCRDGESPREDTACDADKAADGTCTFGLNPKKPVKVRVGETVTIERHDVRFVLKCDR